MVSQQATRRFLKTTTEGELMTKGGDLFHGSTIRTEKNSFSTSQMKNMMAQLSVVTTKVTTRRYVRRTYPAEGHICGGKFHRRELDQPAVFVFQGDIG